MQMHSPKPLGSLLKRSLPAHPSPSARLQGWHHVNLPGPLTPMGCGRALCTWRTLTTWSEQTAHMRGRNVSYNNYNTSAQNSARFSGCARVRPAFPVRRSEEEYPHLHRAAKEGNKLGEVKSFARGHTAVNTRARTTARTSWPTLWRCSTAHSVPVRICALTALTFGWLSAR